MFTKFSRIIVTTICCFCFITNLHAQSTKGWGLIGSTYLNSPFGNYIVDIGVVRTWGFGKYITLGAGAKYSYTQTENLNKDWYSGNQRYAFDFDRSLMGIHSLGTIDAHLPIYKGFGVFANATVSFDLLPWDYLAVRKYDANDPINYDTKTIYAYNQFAPKLFAGGGIYNDFKGEKSTIRVAIGYSYGYYDAFTGCRKKTFEGQNLGEHIPNGDHLQNLSLKIILYH